MLPGGQGGGKATRLRRNQIDELAAQLDALGRQIDESRRAKGQLWLSRQNFAACKCAANSAIARWPSPRENEFKALQNSRQVLEQKIEAVVFEVQNLANKRNPPKQIIELNARSSTGRAGSAPERSAATFIQEQRDHREAAQEN